MQSVEYKSEDISITDLNWNSLDLLPDVVCIINAKGLIKKGNKEFNQNIFNTESQTSYTNQSLVNDFIFPADRKLMEVALKCFLSENSKLNKIVVGVCRTYQKTLSLSSDIFKSYHWVFSGIDQDNILASGRIIAYEGDSSIDEESLKKENQLSDMFYLFSNAQMPIHWISPSGIILWANKAELKLLGYEPEEYIGKNISKVK